MIDKNYYKVVFDRFKRYDEPQKELNPINWLSGGFAMWYQPDPAATQALTGLGQNIMAFLIIRMDKPMKKILLVAGAAMALAGCGEKGDFEKAINDKIG